MLDFNIISETPNIETLKELDSCIKQYVKESKISKYGVNEGGFYQQITNSIANRIILKNQPNAHFWLATDRENKIAGFALSHFATDVDNTLTFWQTDGWVRKDFRNTANVSQWMGIMKYYAILSGAKHILMPCSRASRAWSKFLGGRMKKFVTILKEDI